MKNEQLGIELNYVITDRKDKDITEEQMDVFVDELTKLVESKGWVFGGGAKIINVNEEE
ncbi:hypothetical protein [Bacillus licheniformis]|uniref:hypothetical protein n=1 Tax=Bacillus licheniformis TaxID=1402 RepID=UPI0007919844|nr:hypothetical protein [Bacillus licheniformis]KYC77040.1 hypothetical protein B4092_4777 [Bacillus licheniformis]MDE1407004.1 hypothetical protein [Bacillus licheniformis]TWN76613.1 hypothetical protein CHCC20494_0676 [Bacillus licheniformis]